MLLKLSKTRYQQRSQYFNTKLVTCIFLLVGQISVYAQTSNNGVLISSSKPELIFDGLINTAIGPKSFYLKNTGNMPLIISSLTKVGVNASNFSTNATPATIQPQDSLLIAVSFQASSAGYKEASLRIISNATNLPTFNIGLYALANVGFEGGNEPTLNNVVKTLGYKINVGWTILADGTSPNPKGDEVLVPIFEKSGTGNVSILPLARYSPEHPIYFGYYTNQGETVSRIQVGELLANTPHHQTLFPGLVSGNTTFPINDNVPFGIYVKGLQGRLTYTEDILNVGGPAIHAARIYPIKNRNGVLVPNKYLVAFEDASNGDYQDYVFLLSNVKPFVDAQAPNAPVLSLNAVTSQSISLKWTAASDNVGVTAYEIFNGSNLAGTTSNLNFTINNLSPNTSYNFTVKARDAAGNRSLASNPINATTLAPGVINRFEAETNFTIVSNVGTNGNIIVANNNIASAGKDLRAYDIGDKFKINFSVPQTGQYRLKVRTRSGTIASPQTYWNPLGYSFRLNNTNTIFTPNPSTVSATATTAYGAIGAHFGNVESGIVNLNAGANVLEITMTRTWLGVDYLDVEFIGGGIPDTQAPTAPVLSLGTVSQTSVALNWTASTDNVGVIGYDVFNGASLVGTTANLNFTVNNLTANTAYAFTVKAKDAAGNTSPSSNVINAITSAPPTSVRFEAETNFTIVSNVGTNGNIAVANNNIASAGKDVRAYDIGDKFKINFTVAQNGQYRLKVRNRAGWTVNPIGYWTPAGYAFKLNGTTTGFVGNPSTISATVSTAYGSPGATFGTMESGIVNLNAGAHSLEIEMLKAWLGVDYLEVEFLGSASGVANNNPTENAVEAKEAVTLAQDISKLYPNPTNDEDVYVEFSGEINGKVEYSISDAQGKVFTKQAINLDEPQYVIKIAIANLRLSQGVYYLYIKGDKLQEKIIRFVKN